LHGPKWRVGDICVMVRLVAGFHYGLDMIVLVRGNRIWQ
jgi:hypothetical protein